MGRRVNPNRSLSGQGPNVSNSESVGACLQIGTMSSQSHLFQTIITSRHCSCLVGSDGFEYCSQFSLDQIR